MFNAIVIPLPLVQSIALSAGAKLTLAYGRLLRYAGQDGNCYPAVPTLASEIGMSVRQTQNYLAELERHNLIRRVRRFAGSAQTSNTVQFLWHQLLENGVKTAAEVVELPAPAGVKNPAPEGVKNLAPKVNQIEESQVKETNGDRDYPPANRKKRDSRADVMVASAGCRQYPRLREMLAKYMMSCPDDENIYPSNRQVVDVIDAAGGGTGAGVMDCLAYLFNERGLRPGTRNGPRMFSWFPTVVEDYFSRKRAREQVADPIGNVRSERNEARLSQTQLDSMTQAIEIDGSDWKA